MLNIYVTKRDVEILKFINDMKFSNVDMVRSAFMKDKGRQYLQKRLKKFSDEGYLVRHSDWGGRSFNYLVSSEGVSLILRHGLNTVPAGLKNIDIKNFEHDKILTHLRIKLEESNLVDLWVAERVIRYEEDYLKFGLRDRIIPDAYARSVNRGDQVIIEFEHSRKSNQRIKNLLKSYSNYFTEKRDSEYSRVLFFFSDHRVKKYYEKIYLDMNYSYQCEFFHLSDLDLSVDKIMGGRYVS